MSRNWMLFVMCLGVLAACTPAAQPVSTPTVMVLTEPPPRPSVTPPPATVSPVIDLANEKVLYRDRQEWRARLGWPDECEKTFQRTSPQQRDGFGGVTLYRTTNEKYLVSVTCVLGPYWVEERWYLLSRQTDPPGVTPLKIPELTREGEQDWIPHAVDQIHGLPIFDAENQTLTNLVPFRGPKDCGYFYVYRLEQDRLVLDEARYHDCDDVNPVLSDQWDVVYQRSTASATPASTPAAVTPSQAGSPYLIYKKNIVQHEALVMMNDAGTMRKTLPLPDGAIVGDLAQAVSPRSRWLAFHTGSAEKQTADRYDLALNVLDVATGQTQPITSLLSTDYPANFRRAADALAQQGVVVVEGADSSLVASFFQEAFLNSIHIVGLVAFWALSGFCR